jgi:uncharacterized membrane protein
MTWLVMLLRLLHIGGGVFWAGGTFLFAGVIEPTASAAGPEGGRFIQRLMGGRFVRAMATAGGLAVVAGIWLFSIDSGGFQPAFMRSGVGVMLSIGGLCGLLAAVVGFGVQGRNAGRMKALMVAVQGQAGGPTPGQLAELEAFRKKLRNGGRLAALLLAITIVCMATARYV